MPCKYAIADTEANGRAGRFIEGPFDAVPDDFLITLSEGILFRIPEGGPPVRFDELISPDASLDEQMGTSYQEFILEGLGLHAGHLEEAIEGALHPQPNQNKATAPAVPDRLLALSASQTLRLVRAIDELMRERAHTLRHSHEDHAQISQDIALWGIERQWIWAHAQGRKNPHTTPRQPPESKPHAPASPPASPRIAVPRPR